MITLVALASLLSFPLGLFRFYSTDQVKIQNACAQAAPILPPTDSHNVASVWQHRDRIIKWHQDAIRIPTEVFDDMGTPGEDRRWETFADFHAFLAQAYPLIHLHLRKTTLNTWSLVFEWIGSNETLQPVFLAAHQDVVPVLADTMKEWLHPPFDGYYDGKYIWGRGATDDKAGLTSIMAAIELLLESKHKPERTIILGFGQDEEGGSSLGAAAIRDWGLQKYGRDSMAIVIDEGPGISNLWGQTFGLPSVVEKGKFDLNMTVTTLGGHSSVPPEHTAIGLISVLIAQLERNPYPLRLHMTSPVWKFLQCSASHASEMPKSLKRQVVKSQTDMEAFKSLPKTILDYRIGPDWVGPGMGDPNRALMTTTQATDLISGGMKVNALPEIVTAVINHRIDIASSIQELHGQILETLMPMVKEFHLSLDGFGEIYSPKGHTTGHLQLSGAFGNLSVEPSPISSTALTNPAWSLLAGTARGVWASRPRNNISDSHIDHSEGESLIMAPFMASGNTDTNRYWDLTRNIYRWLYLPTEDSRGAHTVNEKVSADGLLESVRFYQSLILNADASQNL